MSAAEYHCLGIRQAHFETDSYHVSISLLQRGLDYSALLLSTPHQHLDAVPQSGLGWFCSTQGSHLTGM